MIFMIDQVGQQPCVKLITGVAVSFLKVSHLTRTRCSYQVTALVLTKLQLDAWTHFKATNTKLTLEKWRQEIANKSPTFCEFEILVMIFIRAHRIYMISICMLSPWKL